MNTVRIVRGSFAVALFGSVALLGCAADTSAPSEPAEGVEESATKATAAKIAPSCGYRIELAMSADDAWEVYLDGVRLTPTTPNTENQWSKPAIYSALRYAGQHVLAVKANDASKVISGFIANVRINGQLLAGGLTTATTAWKAWTVPNSVPLANWNSAPVLPGPNWGPVTVAATSCKNLWSGNATFVNNWTAAAWGAGTKEWVWTKNCVAQQPGWQATNFYRLELNLPVSQPPVPIPAGQVACYGGAMNATYCGIFGSPPQWNWAGSAECFTGMPGLTAADAVYLQNKHRGDGSGSDVYNLGVCCKYQP